MPHYHQPVGGSYQWNIQGQRQLNNNLVASLAYVASHGHDLPFPVDINQVPVAHLQSNDQQFRPYPQFGTIAMAGAVPNENAISNYNSLQATIQQRLSSWAQLQLQLHMVPLPGRSRLSRLGKPFRHYELAERL